LVIILLRKLLPPFYWYKILGDESSMFFQELDICSTTWRYIPEVSFLGSMNPSVRADGLRQVFELGT
jgi:hypothetical protein